ncbi:MULTISPECIES: DUF5325 family protein [unclassified Paenibacillus]|jgi:hypothetical protein|uniref:DUF5325 family protein n=1 Tax=unclassified Paenibacillus TaxID=185978 RepID=UPI00070CED2E|nr:MULTISPECIES: DUF5325 family protein [unclassified Paenibacillus]KQX45308.1 hypothetical protein ASD40_20475 [Paenibacillus sp. Root444D2]KRE45653.1 hypothetical protein ASG85_06395 [Paenibacillus sp. Soil724D2]
MSKPLALLFAFVGTLLLASISLFIALRQPWMVFACSIISLGFIGYGFVVKAKIRKKNTRS